MPNLPQFKSTEKNVLSIMGKVLNPDCQKMSSLVLDMSRKWGIHNRVRGVALSRDRFQFVFKYEEDMNETMDKAVHTYNEWSMVIDKWMDPFPDDYLKFMMVWIHIRNIPVNYYTKQSIKFLRSIIGEVKEVDFDTPKTQSRDYVRARVLFDVTKPMRRSKVVQFPCRVSENIPFDFEWIKKRCYICQRLTHENVKCPFQKQSVTCLDVDTQVKKTKELTQSTHVIEKDPLMGVLTESQVGINPLTGRPRIHPEVLHEMRQYLLVQDVAERKARELRLQKQMKELENDLIGQSKYLLLQSDKLVNGETYKGKGVASAENNQEQSTTMVIIPNMSMYDIEDGEKKLLVDAMKASTYEGNLSKEYNLVLLPFTIGSTGDKSEKMGNLFTSSQESQTRLKTNSWKRKNGRSNKKNSQGQKTTNLKE